jgi:hypothetical protein
MKKGTAKKAASEGSASDLIDERIADLADWRGDMLSRLRSVIKEAVPDVVEEWKWRGTPCWSHNGLICTGETYKGAVQRAAAAAPRGGRSQSARGGRVTP